MCVYLFVMSPQKDTGGEMKHVIVKLKMVEEIDVGIVSFSLFLAI